MGTTDGDYQQLRLGGGNSAGFLYGSYNKYADKVNLGYNYYADSAGNDVVNNAGGGTSRLSLGYNNIGLYVGGVNSEPTTLGLAVNSVGNVGIGTNSPSEALDVNGSLKLSDNTLSAVNVILDAESSIGLRVANANGYISMTPLNTGWGHITTDRSRFYLNKHLVVDTGLISSYNEDLQLRAGYGHAASILVDYETGDVGIGTNNPTYKLDVNDTRTGYSTYGIKGYAETNAIYSAYGVYGEGKIVDDAGTGKAYGIYGTASGGSTNYAGYFADANVYVEQNISALNVVDRSNWCDMTGEDAVNLLSGIVGTASGDINKITMPSCAVVDIASGYDNKTEKVIYEKGRDLGAYVSYLTIINQEQQKEIELLKSELCKKDQTYSWCLGMIS